MEKEEDGDALRPGRRKASMSFSDRSRPPPFLLFFPLTTRICRCIKSDVYRLIRSILLLFFFSTCDDNHILQQQTFI
ncbi:hypothetical protein P9597_23460 [Aneurinibacillus migulanus]|uniref:hypothetical protein n=1 Tax=Aneurinibacillus migulanus TaxID=47500 RepID=UPI002E1EC624|nr:hypothetical protein [Aneurinibacillus migulanus]